MTAKTTPDPVKALADATRQRATLAEALPELRAQAERADSLYRTAYDERERYEGDALVGSVSADKLAKARARSDEAQQERRRTSAALRQTEQKLLDLDAEIARITPEAQATEMRGFQAYQEELARQLEETFKKAEIINQMLHNNYREAEARFPAAVRRHPAPPLGYPVAAGLTDLSWSELRYNPHAVGGGRLGFWRQRVQAFLRRDTPQPETPRKRQTHLPVRDPRGGGLDVISAHVVRQNGGY